MYVSCFDQKDDRQTDRRGTSELDGPVYQQRDQRVSFGDG